MGEFAHTFALTFAFLLFPFASHNFLLAQAVTEAGRSKYLRRAVAEVKADAVSKTD
jgi:hypothetical protein